MQNTIGKEKIHPPPVGRLGYRGFLVKNGTPRADLPLEFLVFHGVLTERSGTRTIYWRDVGGVEEFLLAEAREREYGKILDALGVGAKGLV